MSQSLQLLVVLALLVLLSYVVAQWFAKRHKSPTVEAIIHTQLHAARVAHLEHAKQAAYHKALCDMYGAEAQRLGGLHRMATEQEGTK